MLLNLDVESKYMGNKQLLGECSIAINERERIALIGRNGVGKSTLFHLLDESDNEFIGTRNAKKGLKLISTRQEHHDIAGDSAVTYILSELPHYAELKHILETYPETMGDDMAKIEEYSHALEQFAELNFYSIEDKIVSELERYQIPADLANGPLGHLSGGQKRFVELVKITEADADLVLIDEPTNHMDYVAKDQFIRWLKNYDRSVVLISHDRDVLKYVDKIIELKDNKLFTYPGNYDAYLAQNSTSTLSGIDQYEVAQRTLEKLHAQIVSARAKKASSSKNPNPFVPMERRLMKQYAELKATVEKPSFWIDQDSVSDMSGKLAEKYDRYKTKNISLESGKADGKQQPLTHLLDVQNVSLGYSAPLFKDITFLIGSGERVQIRGRNGAGKSTLLKTIIATTRSEKLPTTSYSGFIEFDHRLRLGVYEQEIEAEFMDVPLGDAVLQVYHKLGIEINHEKVARILSQYLFNPTGDGRLTINQLSGGQKARFQLIRMFAHEPNLLILDEPTNHLDLPSIEELEKYLVNYHGAILYVSHDSYFTDKLGGKTIQIGEA